MPSTPLPAAARVARLIEALGVTPYQFAKATGLSHQTISNVLTGKNKPGMDTLEAIANRYPAAVAWLLTGQGVPLGTEQPGTQVLTVTTEEVPAYTPPQEPADSATIMRLLAMHKNEMAEMRKEYKAQLLEAVEAKNEALRMDAERHTRDMAAQERFIKSLQEEIFWLKGQLGLRPPTAAEKAAAKKQANTAKPAGFRPKGHQAEAGWGEGKVIPINAYADAA